MSLLKTLPKDQAEELQSLCIKPMSALKQKYIDEMRSKVAEDIAKDSYPDYITCDIELLRFLRGYLWNMDEAIQKYRDMLKWRSDNHINDYIKEVDATGNDPMKVPLSEVFNDIMKSNYSHGTDKEGRIFDIRMMGKTDVSAFLKQPIEDVVKYNVYILEWRIRLFNKLSAESGQLIRMVAIQDIGGVGLNFVSNTLISYFKAISHVTSDNYPETMHKSFIINIPYVFTTLWGLVKPFLHERTVKKISIYSNDYYKDLYEYVDTKYIPGIYGGICPHTGKECIPGYEADGYTYFNVPKGIVHVLPISMDRETQKTLNMDITVKDGDIDLSASVFYNDKEVKIGSWGKVKSHKYSYTLVPEDYVPDSKIVIKISFSNTHSWMNSKDIKAKFTFN
ncbi:hypothetical protein WA158_005526 [Blastocystis sp. Blastoise]